MFTLNDLFHLEVAVRLRAEACEENQEVQGAKTWRDLLAKIEDELHTRIGTIKKMRREA